jgi:hypothetical protein
MAISSGTSLTVHEETGTPASKKSDVAGIHLLVTVVTCPGQESGWHFGHTVRETLPIEQEFFFGQPHSGALYTTRYEILIYYGIASLCEKDGES